MVSIYHIWWTFRCFHLLVVVISAAVSMAVQISQDPMITSFEFISTSGIAELCCISIFNFLRSLYTVFFSSCTILKAIHNTQGSSFCMWLPIVVLSFPFPFPFPFPFLHMYTHTHMNTQFYILFHYCLSQHMSIVSCTIR